MTTAATSAPAAYAFFDLDDTLLDGDSDHLWGEFLCDIGAVDAGRHRSANERYLEQYRNGTLDLDEFLAFQLAPLAAHMPERLLRWREDFVREHIAPRLFDRGRELVAEHRRAGRLPVIVTATNRFITEPIANALGVDDLLATELEVIEGRYTGRPSGQPCSGVGKVAHVHAWLKPRHDCSPHASLTLSWFYSDSANDIPLLEAVGHPNAVNADPNLRREAHRRGWNVIDFRNRPELKDNENTR